MLEALASGDVSRSTRALLSLTYNDPDRMMSNIYLHRLDEFVETVLIPEYTRGRIRKQDTAYARVRAARDRAHRRGDRVQARELRKQLRGMPSGDPHDPGYRRLRYVRYSDDTLLGFTGPKAEAEEIKQRLTTFLRDDLSLELSQDKTLITHARTQAAKFLRYEITVLHNDRKVTGGKRSANGTVSLRVPESVVKAKKAPYLSRGKPVRRPHLINEDDHTIVNVYGAEWRGIAQYYLLAGNVHRLYRLHWVLAAVLTGRDRQQRQRRQDRVRGAGQAGAARGDACGASRANGPMGPSSA
jgi:type II intron maturase